MTALNNVHYGFGYHCKCLSPQTVHYLKGYTQPKNENSVIIYLTLKL